MPRSSSCPACARAPSCPPPSPPLRARCRVRWWQPPWAGPDDPTKNGVIMELHDKATREEAERAIVHMLQESFKVRGWKMRDMQVCAVEHRVERTGCALAAVALLSDDDVV